MTKTEAEQVVSGELEANERSIWVGVPRQGVVFRLSDVLLVPFSMLWGGGVIAWEVMAISAGAPLFVAVWGVPFVFLGLYLIAGRFLVDARRRAATAYALTDRRVIIVSGLFSRSVKSLSLRTLSDVTVTVRRDGSGCIVLGPQPAWGWYWMGERMQAAPSFDLVEDARAVYSQLRAAQSEAQRTG